MEYAIGRCTYGHFEKESFKAFVVYIIFFLVPWIAFLVFENDHKIDDGSLTEHTIWDENSTKALYCCIPYLVSMLYHNLLYIKGLGSFLKFFKTVINFVNFIFFPIYIALVVMVTRYHDQKLTSIRVLKLVICVLAEQKLIHELKHFPSVGKLIMLINKVFQDLVPFMILQINFWVFFSFLQYI